MGRHGVSDPGPAAQLVSHIKTLAQSTPLRQTSTTQCTQQFYKTEFDSKVTVRCSVAAKSSFQCASNKIGNIAPPELVPDALGRFPLESELMGGLQDSMWVVLSHSAVTEKSQVVAARIRNRVVHHAANVGKAL